MAPKKRGIKDFFNQQQRKQTEVRIDENSESCQIVFDKIGNEKSTMFEETMINTDLVNVGDSNRSMNKNTDNLLEINGFDRVNGSYLYYPINEPIRKFEMNIIRNVSTVNCCVAIPTNAPSTSAVVASITSYNFLKWFPRCRVIVICSCPQSYDKWSDTMRLVGIDETQITKIATLSAFKTLKSAPGRVLIFSNPACALKVIESNATICEEVRLLILEMKPNECSTKFKPIVGQLMLKDVLFRVVILTSSVANTSRRTSVITKRQQTITNLSLSDWIEQSEHDHAFRFANIPCGIEVKYWRHEAGDELLQEWATATRDLLMELYSQSVVPSNDWMDLVWSAQLHRRNAEFARVVYKKLLIDGARVADDFIKEARRRQDIEDFINENAAIGEAVRSISRQRDIGHPKYEQLSQVVSTFVKIDKTYHGLILVKDESTAQAVHEYLLRDYKATIRFTDRSPLSSSVWPFSRLSTAFIDRKSPKMLIVPIRAMNIAASLDNLPAAEITFVLSMDRESVFNLRKYHGPYLMLLHENVEKLRNDDGRIFVDDYKPAKESTKIGAVERYDFKFEPSAMKLNAVKLPLNFYKPQQFGERHHAELTAKQHVELTTRLRNPGFNDYRRAPKRAMFQVLGDVNLVVEMSDEMRSWNDEVQYHGNVPSSYLSKRLAVHLKIGDLEKKQLSKKRFSYVNVITDEHKITAINSMIRRIDKIFQL